MAEDGFDDPIASAQVHHVPSIGSTNEECLRLARAGETEVVWLRADVQTQGRGRLGRHWASPPGNLHASLLLRTPAEPRYLPQLAHVAAVALFAAVTEAIGKRDGFALKWPNDLLFRGAKVAGILVEATQDRFGVTAGVIGWGVNCAWHPDELPYPVTDLSSAARRPVSAEDVFDKLRTTMARSLRVWRRGRGYDEIRQAWLDAALPLDTALVVKAGVDLITGRFRGLDDEGRLLLRVSNGLMTIEAGDVLLKDGSAASAG